MLDTLYDVWLQIASFLPADALWDLRGLNHTLYEIAMDNRYRRIKIPLLYELQLRVLEWPYELSNNFKTYEYELCAEMLDREYGHWGLKRFNIIPDPSERWRDTPRLGLLRHRARHNTVVADILRFRKGTIYSAGSKCRWVLSFHKPHWLPRLFEEGFVTSLKAW